jgi:hypothetical protein
MRRRTATLLLAFACATAGGVWACVSDEGTVVTQDDAGACPIGNEGCACTQGGSCNSGLVCLSNLCVTPGSDAGASDSGSSNKDGSSTTSDGGGDSGPDTCLTVLRGGQDQPISIVATLNGLAWVNHGTNPTVVFSDYAGIIKKVVQAPGATGGLASSGSYVVWVDGTSIYAANADGVNQVTVAQLEAGVGAVTTTNTNAYFSMGAYGVYYCALGGGPCTSPSVLGPSTSAQVWGLGVDMSTSTIFWADSTLGTGGVRSCHEGDCDASTDYGMEPKRTAFVIVSGTAPLWTTFVNGAVRKQGGTIATGSPSGFYHGLATDGFNVFFQGDDIVDGSSVGGIYGVPITANGGSGKLIQHVTYPNTTGVASGITYGNSHFYFTDEATGNIYAWKANCTF